MYKFISDELEETETAANGEKLLTGLADGYIFFYVHVQIKSWKKCIQPITNTIEDLAQRSKIMVQK